MTTTNPVHERNRNRRLAGIEKRRAEGRLRVVDLGWLMGFGRAAIEGGETPCVYTYLPRGFAQQLALPRSSEGDPYVPADREEEIRQCIEICTRGASR